jgi:hypothetical protein
MVRLSVRRIRVLMAAVILLFSGAMPAQQPHNNLSGNTVLIVRHAEKPATGMGLTPMGEARAQAYAKYFVPFHDGGLSIHIDSLFAGADSTASMRPRLTLEPLSKVTGLPLNTEIGTKDQPALVKLLTQTPHGMHPLIAWRHGEIPALLEAFGASPAKLLPMSVWPDEVYDWVIVLTFDGEGRLASQMRVQEHLTVTMP